MRIPAPNAASVRPLPHLPKFSHRGHTTALPRPDRMNSARAFAPGGIGNIGPGLDILGCAVTGAGDSVRASFDGHRGVVVSSSGHPDLSPDPTPHASAIAAAEVIRRARSAGIDQDVGIVLDVEK